MQQQQLPWAKFALGKNGALRPPAVGTASEANPERQATRHRGVVPNFGLLVGTGAGRRAQDMTELEI